VRIAVEAGVRQGWDRWLLGEKGREAKTDFIGMDRFGASAPAETLFEHFGITVDQIVARAEALL
jgi:transketolase